MKFCPSVILLFSSLYFSNCATTPPVYANFYVERETGDKKFAIQEPISIEFSLPNENWTITKINSYQFRFTKANKNGIEKSLEISILSRQKLEKLVGKGLTDPVLQYIDWEIDGQLKSGPGFKLNSKSVEKSNGYFEIESDSQITGNMRWIDDVYLITLSYIFFDKALFEKNKIIKIFKEIIPIDVKEFNKKIKAYNSKKSN